MPEAWVVSQISTKIEDFRGKTGQRTRISTSSHAPNSDERDERTSRDGASIALPAHVAGSGTLDRLVDTARDYARGIAASDNTEQGLCEADWKHFAAGAG